MKPDPSHEEDIVSLSRKPRGIDELWVACGGGGGSVNSIQTLFLFL